MPRNKPDLTPVSDFVRVWGRAHQERAKAVVEHPALRAAVAAVEAGLRSSPVRSSILIGAPGAGKTAHALALSRRLHSRGWTIIEATASDLMSGQTFIGQVDERIQGLVETMGTSPTLLWVCPDIHQLVWAGRHLQSPIGLLERLMPHLESGAVRLLGETTPQAFELLTQLVPKVRSVFEPVRLDPCDDQTTLGIARSRFGEGTDSGMADAVIVEAKQLADQFLVSAENPGRLLGLIVATRERVTATGSSGDPVGLNDILTTLTARTGIPGSLLDDREQIDLDQVRTYFDERILGQPEAVATVVERIALVKAGLSDPTRPMGVFLFVGPTGTGKTEIAKTLASYLFGSPERLLRLDMSEFQDAASLDRLLGERGSVADPNALVTRIRQSPFSVVLLDEFEKAAPAIWDLFLQLFDDGRLTARDGETADFRNAIVIMTSNLGSEHASGSPLGFGGVATPPGTTSVSRALESAFRPEFLNRLDRVVVFKPLSRPVMRRLLHLELRTVFERRGLRRRGWAVEWDQAALEFLLESGFSPTLGARPLKRAVERHFLAPLAEVIVEHRAPEGEQFLFVHLEGGGLTVEFVDPDAPASPDPALLEAVADGATPRLEDIALAGVGAGREMTALVAAYETLVEKTEGEAWQAAKQDRLRAMAEDGFWDRPDRFHTLGLAEYMDRIEAGVRTAGSLLKRLGQSTTPPAGLVRRLAEQLYLVREASSEIDDDHLGDAFVQVSSAPTRLKEGESESSFARRLVRMYTRWADKRRMKIRTLREGMSEDGRFAAVLAVTGFGAHRILAREVGRHVFEGPGETGGTRKERVSVVVARQPHDPLPRDDREALEVARGVLASLDEGPPRKVVRRYRAEPAPLVRDAVRGWRTGNLDTVLDGDFDLIS